MKSNALTLACAVSLALAVSACNHDDGTNDSVASAANESLASPEGTAAASMSSDMTTQPLPMPNADATTAPPTSAASPAGPASDNDLSFEDMDKNHDGSVAASELDDNDPLKAHFSDIDGNHDGKLSKDEISKYRQGLSAAASTSSPKAE